MFGPEAPPLEWDTEGAYSRGAIEVYYLSNGAAPLTERQLEEVDGGPVVLCLKLLKPEIDGLTRF